MPGGPGKGQSHTQSKKETPDILKLPNPDPWLHLIHTPGRNSASLSQHWASTRWLVTLSDPKAQPLPTLLLRAKPWSLRSQDACGPQPVLPDNTLVRSTACLSARDLDRPGPPEGIPPRKADPLLPPQIMLSSKTDLTSPMPRWPEPHDARR